MRCLFYCSILVLITGRGVFAEDSTVDRAELYKKLHNPIQAEDAFCKLASTGPKKIGRWHVWTQERLFLSATPSFVRQTNGVEIAVVQLHIYQLVCGNGKYDSGILPPTDLLLSPYINQVLIFDELGKPVWSVNSIAPMAIYDAVGDGKKAELIRWSQYGASFLIIHDLSKPDFPVMLNLVFNPTLTEWDYHNFARDEDGNLTLLPPEKLLPPEPPHPTRFGRWSFVAQKDTKLHDIVIEEKKHKQYEEVARFVFDSDARRWTGPKGGKNDLWELGTVDQSEANITSLITDVRYKKYDPNAEKKVGDNKKTIGYDE